MNMSDAKIGLDSVDGKYTLVTPVILCLNIISIFFYYTKALHLNENIDDSTLIYTFSYTQHYSYHTTLLSHCTLTTTTSTREKTTTVMLKKKSQHIINNIPNNILSISKTSLLLLLLHYHSVHIPNQRRLNCLELQSHDWKREHIVLLCTLTTEDTTTTTTIAAAVSDHCNAPSYPS